MIFLPMCKLNAAEAAHRQRAEDIAQSYQANELLCACHRKDDRNKHTQQEATNSYHIQAHVC